MLTKMAAFRITLLTAFIVSVIHPTRTQALSLQALDPESLPNTNFSCIGKVIGGYYADTYTGCQMFHVCTLDEKGEIHDYKFGCIPGTVFDQETRVCERADEVDCSISESFFHLNDDLYGPGIIPPTAVHRVSGDAAVGTDFQTTTQPAFVFPVTSFSCHDKVSGGLYADIETGCAVFHICSVGPDSSTIDNKFVCGDGTLFDQKSRTCQTSSAVDCSRAESLFYLNDRLKGPEDIVDLCLIQPLGTPLADLTSGCQKYIVCMNVSDEGLEEQHHDCKKGYLFSQLRKQCLPHKKVKCVKETLTGLLSMDSSKKSRNFRRSRMTRSLLLHRLRRAALPPLANAVTNAGMEDARVRRALFSLAALQRWALENSRDTTFIEVYTLNSRDVNYPKKVFGEGSHLTRYGYILRKKRDVVNNTSAEQVLVGNQTKAEETLSEPDSLIESSLQEPEETHQDLIINPTTTIPVIIPTITIAPKNGVPTPIISKETVLPITNSITPSPSFNPSPTKIIGTLSTVTISNTGPRTTTVTLPPATVTVTNTVTIGLQNTDNPIVNTAVPTLPTTSDEQPIPLPTPSSTVTAVDMVGNVTRSSGEIIHSTLNVTGETVANSTIGPSISPVENGTNTGNATVLNTSSLLQNQTVELPHSDTDIFHNTTIVSSSPATTLQPDVAVTEPSVETDNSTISTNVTTTTVSSITKVVPPEGSINASTTVIPSDSETSSNSSETAVTQAPAPTTGPFTRENLPETSFTCKDKKLEQFYPDTEANCQVFHYCSPGFDDTQILDLKFLCTGATMFDVNTQKCENMTNVTCGEGPTITDPPSEESSEGSQGNTTVSVEIEDSHDNQTALTEGTVGNVSVSTTPVVENATLITNGTQLRNDSVDPSILNATVEIANATLANESFNLNMTTTEHHNWNSTLKPEIQDASNETTLATESTDTAQNVNQIPESATEAETLPGDLDSDTSTSTPESLLDEATTEVSFEDIEPVTERFAREEIPTSTVDVYESSTTEFPLEDESLLTTELGPFSQPHDNMFEPLLEAESIDESVTDKVEPTTDISIQTSTNSVPLLNTSIPQISSTSDASPALNDTNVSTVASNDSSISVSENTNVETP